MGINNLKYTRSINFFFIVSKTYIWKDPKGPPWIAPYKANSFDLHYHELKWFVGESNKQENDLSREDITERSVTKKETSNPPEWVIRTYLSE